MRKAIPTFLFFLFFSFSATALEQGQYGFGLYGDNLYGGYSSGSKAETKEVVLLNNETFSLNVTNTTDTSIEFDTNGNTSGSVTVVKSSLKPINSTDPKSGLGKYITISVDSEIQNNLNNSIIKIFYNDSEISSLQETTLRLYRFNGTVWNIFDGAGIGGVDASNNLVFANTSRFSTWSVFGDSTPASPSSSGGGGSSGSGGGGKLFNGEKDKFESGIRTETFAYGDALQFYIDNKIYTLVMLKLEKDSAKLRITPGYIDFTVQNIKAVDIDGNGVYDLQVQLNKILSSYSAEFTFSLLKETETGGGPLEEPKPIENLETPEVKESIEAPTQEAQQQPESPKQDKISLMAKAIITLILGVMGVLAYAGYKFYKNKKR